ncbi:hypothetical protein B296_00002406 [Ensete ventricosum]|uniref:Uncharacterized protein n=1 Tax=Ensete ventricosum TaxID=4639 RepID=A0A427ACC8_ENSVE|nr:hypothetical protein B296_00002406 [Ensete ventricosum]
MHGSSESVMRTRARGEEDGGWATTVAREEERGIRDDSDRGATTQLGVGEATIEEDEGNNDVPFLLEMLAARREGQRLW